MGHLDRRHLLLGGASALLAGGVPLATAAPASAAAPHREIVLEGFPDDATARITATAFGNGSLGAVWSTRRDGPTRVFERVRLDYRGGIGYWRQIPHRGRLLQMRPLDARTGIFGPTTPYEIYRTDVNGFGVVQYRADADRIRYQVVGSGGRHFFGDLRRFGNPSAVQPLVETFVDQTNVLNLQYQTYVNTVRQWGLAALPALVAGTAGLIVTGANPVTVIALIGAAATGGITLVANVRNTMNAYLTSYNDMIETYERLLDALGQPPARVPRYDVAGTRWNVQATQTVVTPSYALIDVPSRG